MARAGAIAATFVTMLSCASASANGGGIKVLGCVLPLPAGYVLDGTSFDGIVLYQEPDAAGHIRIGDFEGYPERFTIVAQRTAGHLTIDEIVVNSTGRPLEPIVAIRDDKHIVSLIGDARNLADVFVSACLGEAASDSKAPPR